MLPSTPSAERDADASFRERRVARLRRNRSRRRLGWLGWGVLALVAVAALAITVHRSQPEDRLQAEATRPKILKDIGPRQGATGCVGWPRSLTPSDKPTAREGAVTVWGDRSAFHFRNAAGGPVVIEVTARGGALRPVDSDAAQDGDERLRFELAPDSEARFTAACSVTSLTFAGTDASGAPLGEGAFQMGTGPGDAPLVIDKVVR